MAYFQTHLPGKCSSIAALRSTNTADMGRMGRAANMKLDAKTTQQVLACVLPPHTERLLTSSPPPPPSPPLSRALSLALILMMAVAWLCVASQSAAQGAPCGGARVDSAGHVGAGRRTSVNKWADKWRRSFDKCFGASECRQQGDAQDAVEAERGRLSRRCALGKVGEHWFGVEAVVGDCGRRNSASRSPNERRLPATRHIKTPTRVGQAHTRPPTRVSPEG